MSSFIICTPNFSSLSGHEVGPINDLLRPHDFSCLVAVVVQIVFFSSRYVLNQGVFFNVFHPANIIRVINSSKMNGQDMRHAWMR
jgi:hypothetical protein